MRCGGQFGYGFARSLNGVVGGWWLREELEHVATGRVM